MQGEDSQRDDGDGQSHRQDDSFDDTYLVEENERPGKTRQEENDDKSDNSPERRKLFGERHREIQKLVEFHDLILLNKADDCNCIMN